MTAACTTFAGGTSGKRNRFFVESVDAYDRHDLLDSRWTVHRTPASGTVVYGTLGDEDVHALLKLSNAAAGSTCRLSGSAPSLVRLQCAWMNWPMDMRSWVYAREGKTWVLVAKTDGVRL